MTSPTNNNINLKKGMTLKFSVKSGRHNTRTSVVFSGDLSADCDSKKCSSKCLKDLSSILKKSLPEKSLQPSVVALLTP
jgi:hypothetical protein